MSERRTPCQSARGFTLVELLVVIGIIAILIAILLPVLSKVREQAKGIVCLSNEKQLVAAFMAYVTDQDGATPIPPGVPGHTYPGDTDVHRSLMYYMDSQDGGAGSIRYDVGPFWKYVSGGIQLPGNPPPGHEVTPPPPQLYRVFNCPSDTDFRSVQWGGVKFAASLHRNFSYSWNGQLSPDVPLVGKDSRCVSRLFHIIEPAHKIILEEEAHPNDAWSWAGFTSGGGANDPDDVPAFRHNGRCNMAFADGHAESFDLSELGYAHPTKYEDAPAILNPKVAAYYFHLQSNEQ